MDSVFNISRVCHAGHSRQRESKCSYDIRWNKHDKLVARVGRSEGEGEMRLCFYSEDKISRCRSSCWWNRWWDRWLRSNWVLDELGRVLLTPALWIEVITETRCLARMTFSLCIRGSPREIGPIVEMGSEERIGTPQWLTHLSNKKWRRIVQW